ncbi:hypothetical protein PTTG_04456 [Puccinia triticina 1-1 BBBD Race 1]|uniref:DNA repair and recombination protein RAD52 n=2 Tax=Puccinia triticina TaxID=208348 RepID=A0A180G939_PUCT1|nr:uncharacterized protein PtA15_6A129 [Puccinia triticina]OAV88842.1 hypothetical protein PTTG_04456 [Puccinia triticina 1-1 BBBD Race 1]WAQ85501.1 hypothetical protein PtA15_6A129 [Puccinia triticina]WAR55382.1 hypothetical protein PtB15_6B123 [Puccinia triticina]
MYNHTDQKPGVEDPNGKQEPTYPIAGSSTSTGHPHPARQPAQLQSILSKQLGPEYLSNRPGAGGCKLTYIEGWRVIALANEVFGFDGWSSETKSIEVDFVDQTADGRFNVGVSATVRISLRNGGSHEDVGYGKLENSKSKADALDKCKKEAVTDALKRTLRTFGNLMGNCLYDKTYLNNIKTMQAQKEKFMPSKLYRPEHVGNTRTSSAQSESFKPSENQSASEEEKVPQKPSRPAQPLIKPAAQVASKPTAPISYKAAAPIPPKKPLAAPPPRPALQVSADKKNPPTAPSRPLADKRKLPEDEPAEEEEGGGGGEESEMGDEETRLAPPPPTLSDKYFEFDEADLAELDQAESIDLVLCAVQQQPQPEGGSPDESGLITDTSLQTDADTSTAVVSRPHQTRPFQPPSNKILPSHVNRPAPPKPSYPPKNTILNPGQLPAVKAPIQSAIRYPTAPIQRKPSLLNPHHNHPTINNNNRPAKKVRTAD